jgi:tripartite-type tricarboxylate transporter receptor subunit TctC
MTHVPYKGMAPANQDLIGGQIDIFLAPYGKSYEELHKTSKVKVLAMLNSDRLDGVKDFPAISESRALKDFTFTIWTGYFVKKDTPEAVVQALSKAIGETLNDPAVKTALEANSQMLAKPQALPAMAKLYADGTAQFRAIAKSIDMQPQ